MSSRHRARRPVRALVLSIALLGSGSLVGWLERPAEQMRRALATLEARDWERLQYQQLALPRTTEYAAPSRLFVAALQLERRDFLPALRELRFAAADPSIRPLAWVLSGEALYAQNRFREAELNFKHALELDPHLVDAHRWLAIAYYDIGLMAEALRHLRQVAELDPRDPRPHRIMAVIHLDRGSYAIAVEDYEESLRRAPGQPDRQEILTELAQAQLALKRFADAQRTLAGCHESADVLAMQADAFFALGDSAEAKRLAERALETESDQRLALLVLGKLALGEHRSDDAVDLLSKAAQAARSDYDVQYTLLTALRAAGRTQDAEKQLRSVEELRRLREHFDGLLEQAVAEPYNAEIRYQMGVVADRLDMPRVAQSWLKAAIVLNPQHRLAQSEVKKHGAALFNTADALRGN
jgi:tetratricopeptide (TPR) repeat protein